MAIMYTYLVSFTKFNNVKTAFLLLKLHLRHGNKSFWFTKKKPCLSCSLMLPRTRFDNSFWLSVQSINRKILKKYFMRLHVIYLKSQIINEDKRFNIAEYCQQTVIHNRLSDHLILRFIKTGSEELDFAEFMLIILNN